MTFAWNTVSPYPSRRSVWNVQTSQDLIIAEDDPYFFLQAGEFVPKSQRKAEPEPESVAGEDVERFVASLIPTFLSVDTQGRVIRMETLSKVRHSFSLSHTIFIRRGSLLQTIAPGMRLGWFTCNPLFADRLERIGETSTQSPCGLGQALFMALISQWTFSGYVRWLRGLRTQYRQRRDFFIDCLADEFDLFPTSSSAISPMWASATVVSDRTFTVLSAYARGGSAHEKTTRRPLLSFVPPSSGMFVWLELYFGDVPDETDEDGSVKTPEYQFWERLADAGVLAVPGSYFLPERYAVGGSTSDGGASARVSPSVSADGRIGHLRLSYTPADVSASFYFIFPPLAPYLLIDVARIAFTGERRWR
jgi:aromatic amino acid aminotransferase I / 2-aminoadipate transaminase